MVVHVTMDDEEEISAKMINEHNENDLGIKFVSFKWALATGITNAARMRHHKKECLRFEVLKEIRIDDEVEYGNDLSSAKEMFRNVETNSRKVFVGIEQGSGKTKMIFLQ